MVWPPAKILLSCQPTSKVRSARPAHIIPAWPRSHTIRVRLHNSSERAVKAFRTMRRSLRIASFYWTSPDRKFLADGISEYSGRGPECEAFRICLRPGYVAQAFGKLAKYCPARESPRAGSHSDLRGKGRRQ